MLKRLAFKARSYQGVWPMRRCLGMNIALKVLAGPLKDQVFAIEKPITLGRQGDIVLEDPKVSGVHAHVHQTSSGKWVIVDNESKNGIRVKEFRVRAVTLKPGVVFHIGDSTFEVISTDPQPAAEAPAPEKKKKQKLWYEALKEFLIQHKGEFKDKSRPLIALEPAVVLEFARGVQANSKWIVGYGPRRVGATCIDLPIWEPGAPDVCFELHPTNDGILFKTEHADIVRLNQQQVDSRVLHVGDTISIHETLIEVDFTE